MTLFDTLIRFVIKYCVTIGSFGEINLLETVIAHKMSGQREQQQAETHQIQGYIIGRWTDGKPHERTARKKNDGTPRHGLDAVERSFVEMEKPNDPSLDGFSGFMNDGPISEFTGPEGFTRRQTKRDSFNSKLDDREMFTQTSQNPFLAGNSYSHDLQIQEEFLRPRNTNQMVPNTNG